MGEETDPVGFLSMERCWNEVQPVQTSVVSQYNYRALKQVRCYFFHTM